MTADAQAPLLLHVFPTFAVGGAQQRMVAVANHFGHRWRHAIVALDGNTEARTRLSASLEVHFTDIAARKNDTLDSVWRSYSALRALHPTVLITHNWGSIEWAIANLLTGLRHVHIEDGFGPEERARQLPRRVLTRRLMLRRTTVVLPSRTLLRIAMDIWRLPKHRLRFVPNGIDLCRFAPGEPDAAQPWPRDLPVIGTVAALRPEKNLHRLLDAFALLRTTHAARLVIVGDGPLRTALEGRAAELGIAASVIFTGVADDTSSAYRNFDAFALSSDTEQMPLSVLEAMGCGLPVVATDVGDVRAMLAEANRRYVVGPDPEHLARALAALLDAPAHRQAIGTANRDCAVAAYGQERMFAEYAKLFGMPEA